MCRSESARRRRCAALVVLLALLPALATANEASLSKWAPRTERFSVSDGLPDLSLFSVVQDHDGYLWIGSARGIARFDGYGFRSFRHDAGDPHSLSYDNAGNLFVDSSGRLWVGTWGGGLNLIDPRSGRSQRYARHEDDPDGLPSNHVQAFFEDAQGRIWIATRNGAARFDEARQRPQRVFGDEAGSLALNADRIWGIGQTRDGSLWLAASANLVRLDPDSGRFERLPLPGEADAPAPLRLLFVDTSDQVWVATIDGLYRYDRQRQGYERVEVPPGAGETAVIASAVHAQSPGRYWVAAWRGLWLLDTDDRRFVPLDGGDRYRWFEADDIRGVYVDTSGILWAATRQRGLARVNLAPSRFRLFGSEIANLPGNFGSPAVTRIDSGRGAVWLSGGVGPVRADIDNGEFVAYGALQGWSPRHASAIAFGNRGELFYAGRNGPMRFVPGRQRQEPLGTLAGDAGLGDGNLLLVHRDSRSRLWWITGAPQYVVSDLDGKLLAQWRPGADSGAAVTPQCVHEAPDGALWMCSLLGLVSYDDSAGFRVARQVQADPDSLSHDAVYSLLHDADGRFWVGTQVALDLFDPVARRAVRHVPEGMSELRVESMVESEPGLLWLASGGLLYRFDARQRRFLGPPLDPGEPGLFFHPRAAMRLDAGRLLFGTNQGLLVVAPELPAQLPFVPPVHVGAAWIDRQPVPLDAAQLLVPPQARSLELEFVALDYRDPSRNRYAYRLEGFDDDWRVASAGRIATYTNLVAGDYRFHVRGAGLDEAWNEEGASLAIRVLRPWWEEPLLHLAAVALLALAILLAVRLHFRNVRRRQAVLEHQVAERTRDLELARDAAQQAGEAKTHFLATMSHEIRTPLNAVIGFSALGTRLELSPGLARDYFQRISRAGRTLLDLVNDVLDFSKVEAGRLELESAPFDLAELMSRLHDLFAGSATEKGIELRFELAPDLPAVLIGDPLRLGQVLTNLIGNAVKFTERGQVRIVVEALQQSDAEAVLRFAVEDTGIGISAEQVPLLFAAFTQADAGISRRYGGTGLGLSISQRLVRLMDGVIEVESMPGVGSRFVFDVRFGRGQVPTDAEVEAGLAIDPGLAGLRVLLVEDNPINQQVALAVLAQARIVAEAASGGEEALAMLAKLRFDAVLMDLHMPGMDGYQTTALIRAQPQFGELPIIAMTAHAVAGYRERCLAAGMNDYLTKPIEPARLFDALAASLGRQPACAAVGSVDPPAVAESAEPIDRDALLYRLADDRELMRRLLADFARDFAGFMPELNKALEQGDGELARRLLHTLKGVAANLGAMPLSRCAAALEHVAEPPSEELATLDRALQCSLQRAAELIAEPASAAGEQVAAPEDLVADIDGTALRILLDELQARIRRQDPLAENLLSDLRELLGASVEPDLLRNLEKSLRRYDFRAAAEQLGRLREALLPQLS